MGAAAFGKTAPGGAVQPALGKKAIAYLPLSTPHNPIVTAAEFLGKSGAGGYGDWPGNEAP